MIKWNFTDILLPCSVRKWKYGDRQKNRVRDKGWFWLYYHQNMKKRHFPKSVCVCVCVCVCVLSLIHISFNNYSEACMQMSQRHTWLQTNMAKAHRMNHCSSPTLSRILSPALLHLACLCPILTYADPILLRADSDHLKPLRIIERRALCLINRWPLRTWTSSVALYTLNTLFPDLNSFLFNLNRHYVPIQSIAESIHQSTRNVQRPFFLIKCLLALANIPPRNSR